MSKVLILSDIHSNIYALEAIWAQESDSQAIYCTGDLVDYGPFPDEVIEWVRAHDVICVQGNHDRWVVTNYRAGRTLEQIPPSERAWVHHNAGRLAEEAVAFLEGLPEALIFELDGLCYGLTHMYRDYEEIVSLYDFEQFVTGTFKGKKPERLILGHTHRQAVRFLSDHLLWLNPGSVSYRRPGDPDQTTHYATITDGQISLKRLAYGLDPLRQAVEQVVLKESEMQTARRFFR